jgi:hypothetical protein
MRYTDRTIGYSSVSVAIWNTSTVIGFDGEFIVSYRSDGAE